MNEPRPDPRAVPACDGRPQHLSCRGAALLVDAYHHLNVVPFRSPRLNRTSADARGDTLRLGPAPYLDDQQIRDGVAALGDVVKGIRRA